MFSDLKKPNKFIYAITYNYDDINNSCNNMNIYHVL